MYYSVGYTGVSSIQYDCTQSLKSFQKFYSRVNDLEVLQSYWLAYTCTYSVCNSVNTAQLTHLIFLLATPLQHNIHLHPM